MSFFVCVFYLVCWVNKMDFRGSYHERRRDRRFEVNLYGTVDVRHGSIPVCIIDISLGGAQVKLLTAGHYSLEAEIFSLSISDYGTYPCAVVMRSDLIFRLNFIERPFHTSSLARFLKTLAEPDSRHIGAGISGNKYSGEVGKIGEVWDGSAQGRYGYLIDGGKNQIGK